MYYEKNHSLEARLRPEDKYCKPALARSVPVTNMVLRVRRRRWKKCKGGGEGEEEGEDQSVRVRGPGCHVEVLGLVKQNFEFTGIYTHAYGIYIPTRKNVNTQYSSCKPCPLYLDMYMYMYIHSASRLMHVY